MQQRRRNVYAGHELLHAHGEQLARADHDHIVSLRCGAGKEVHGSAEASALAFASSGRSTPLCLSLTPVMPWMLSLLPPPVAHLPCLLLFRGRVRSPSRPAGSRVVPSRCCCRWSWCVRLSAPPCAPLFGPRVSAIRRPFPPCFIYLLVGSKRLRRHELFRMFAHDIVLYIGEGGGGEIMMYWYVSSWLLSTQQHCTHG